MIPCVKTIRTINDLWEMSQAELVKTCVACPLPAQCDMGNTILSEIKAFKADPDPEGNYTKPKETLEEIAQTSMTYGEYCDHVQKQKKLRGN